MPLALYRKHRPKRLQDVKGQNSLKVLTSAIRTGAIHHAYIFRGMHGSGKTTTARLYAQAINCSKLDQFLNPCLECLTCKNPNFCMEEINSATNRGINDIKSILDELNIRPVGKYRVYIFDEFQQLSTDAISALLKVVEEPPKHVVFIFCTTDNLKGETQHAEALNTLASRCMTLLFNPIATDVIMKEVKIIARKEKIYLKDDTLKVIGRKAKGSMRDAIGMIDLYYLMQDVTNLVTPEEEYALNLLDRISNGESALCLMAEIEENFIEPISLWEALLEFIRDVVFLKTFEQGAIHTLDVEQRLVALSKHPYDWHGLAHRFMDLERPADYSQLQMSLITL